MFITTIITAIYLVSFGESLNIIVYSRTNGFRHGSISSAKSMLEEIANDNEWILYESEDGNIFNDNNFLDTIDVIIFCLTSGNNILDNTQKSNFENWYLNKPGGFIGLHSATDTEYDWEFYGNMLGAYFSNHPSQQHAALTYTNPIRSDGQSITWTYLEEWYNFNKNIADYDSSEGYLILGRNYMLIY